MREPPGDVTVLLQRLSAGDQTVADELIGVLYKELKRIAASHMRRERVEHTLQPTALVHEAYLRLVQQCEVHWQSRSHFLAIASKVMRRVLVDHARAKLAARRGGAASLVQLDDAVAFTPERSLDIIAIDASLERLARLDPRQVQIVELRFFAGLTVEEAAQILSLSPRTVKREWNVAKAWLAAELSGSRLQQTASAS